MKYTTPKLLEQMLQAHLRNAGFTDATAAKGTKYVTEGNVPCLKVGLFKWPQTSMSWQMLQGYARALSELPGVVRTEIVHQCQAINLRDQVIVIHRRMWEEPGGSACPACDKVLETVALAGDPAMYCPRCERVIPPGELERSRARRRLTEGAQDVIDQAVSEGKLPG